MQIRSVCTFEALAVQEIPSVESIIVPTDPTAVNLEPDHTTPVQAQYAVQLALARTAATGDVAYVQLTPSGDVLIPRDPSTTNCDPDHRIDHKLALGVGSICSVHV